MDKQQGSGLPWRFSGKESTCSVGDLDSVPELVVPLEEGTVTHSTILAWRILKDRGAWWAAVHGVTKSWTLLSD